MNRHNYRARGSFVIEFVFVLIALCSICFFATDLSQRLLLRSQLDSAAFSLVNILKERTRYYSVVSGNTQFVRYILNNNDLKEMQLLASRVLHVPEQNVALSLESNVDNDIQQLSNDVFDRWGCQPAILINEHDALRPRKDDGSYFPLYQLTLCVRHDGWYLPFVSGQKDSKIITSSAVSTGW